MITTEQLKETRVRLGESQAAFGTRFGVDQSTVHRWETDGIPQRGATRVAIERVLADLDVESAASQTEGLSCVPKITESHLPER